MKPVKLVVSMIFLAALLPNWPARAAAERKQVVGQRGGNAPDHMSEKGFADGNAQWSADPERGWVRAEKRQGLHEQSGTARDSHRQSDKAKRKRKKD